MRDGAGIGASRRLSPSLLIALRLSRYNAMKGTRMAQIGYVLSHEQFRTPQLLEFSVAAERAGFDMLWTSDHFHPWQDNQGHAGQAWITLAAVGQKVSLPFGTGVTCPTFRYHPAVVAQAFASLGVLYPGRVFLGLGTGEALNEQAVTSEWGDYDERAERFMEAVQIIRQLHTGEWTTFAGDYYEVGPAKLYDIPEQPVPLYLAAEGPKAMHLAGKFGDGVISDSKTLMQPEMRQQFEAGAREAGKDPQAMTRHAEQFVIVGGEAERDAAARLWRFLPKAWTEYVNDPDPRDIEKGALATITPEQTAETWVVSTDPQVHTGKLQALIDGGVTHIYVHPGNADQEHAIEFYGKEVLPHLSHGK